MISICPTVTASNLEEFHKQLTLATNLSRRVHVDFMDGQFTPNKSPDIGDTWHPAGVTLDLHIMYKRPLEQLGAIIGLQPDLVIVHAEAEEDFEPLADFVRQASARVGLALLQDTPVSQIEPIIDQLDHVLIFSGTLGHFGGIANLSLLNKVQRLKQLKPTLEIGWDGGISDRNIAQLVAGGVDVLNVGGYIHRAISPAHAYATLKAAAQQIPPK